MKKTSIAALLCGLISVSGVHAQAIMSAGSNYSLTSGNYISTRSGNYHLIMQGDGNVVLYFVTPGGTRTAGFSHGKGGHLDMQNDGNLALYTSTGTWAWNSGTGGHPTDPGYKLVIFETGEMQILDAQNRMIKQVADIDRGKGAPAQFPFRRTSGAQCVDGFTPPLLNGAAAIEWALANNGTVGYCNSIF